MIIYTNKDLDTLFPLNIKSFKECGVSENKIVQIFADGLVHSFLEINNETLFKNNVKGTYTEFVEEEADIKIKELEEIQSKEREEYYKQTDSYKINLLSTSNANLLKDSATKSIEINKLKQHNATMLIDNANKTTQINNLNKSLATVTLELAKLKAQK